MVSSRSARTSLAALANPASPETRRIVALGQRRRHASRLVVVGPAVDHHRGQRRVVLRGERCERLVEPRTGVPGDDEREDRRVRRNLVVRRLVVRLGWSSTASTSSVSGAGSPSGNGAPRSAGLLIRGASVSSTPPRIGSRRPIPRKPPDRLRPAIDPPGTLRTHDRGTRGWRGFGPVPGRPARRGRSGRRGRRGQHRRRRLVPRAAGLPRPRFGHLHPRRGEQPRHGLGPRRRDVRHPRRARSLRRPHVVQHRRP